MPELNRELLERPPEETARILALSLLDEATDGAQRMEKGEDPEALHDFRVGLRRLRSCARAYRPHLHGSIKKKLRKRLKALASSTNQARDTEVQLAWLEPRAAELAPVQQTGLAWLTDCLKRRHEQALAPSLETVLREFESLRQILVTKLSVCEYRLDLTRHGPPRPFLSVTGELVCRHVADLEEVLFGVGSVADQEKLHRARIAGKRVRYLLEPLRVEIDETRELVRRFKALQDVLGEIHDTHVLESEISSALEKTAIERARRLHEAVLTDEPDSPAPTEEEWQERHGLLELARLLKVRGDGLFARLEAEFLGDGGREIFRSVADLGQRLASGVEDARVCRRYLLDRLPERAAGAPSQLIEEGWLRNKTEGLRRVRTGRRTAHFHILQMTGSPQGITQSISRKHFQTLWPLTERRRLRMRRYEVTEGDATWVVHDFEDRALVLVETERRAGRPDPEFPPWLASGVKREVTGEARYEGLWLATHLPRRRSKRGPPKS